MLGAGAPDERERSGNYFLIYFHNANIVNQQSEAKRKIFFRNILSAFCGFFSTYEDRRQYKRYGTGKIKRRA